MHIRKDIAAAAATAALVGGALASPLPRRQPRHDRASGRFGKHIPVHPGRQVHPCLEDLAGHRQRLLQRSWGTYKHSSG